MHADLKNEEQVQPSWDIVLTGEIVTSTFGNAQWLKARRSVRAMADRPEFCRYHYHEAINMMEGYIDSELKEEGLFGIYQDYAEFSLLMQKIRANIVAFIQSLHAVADTCAHMLYYSLALDRLPNSLKEQQICAKEVLKLLEYRRSAGKSEYDKLCRLFREVTAGEDYKYLCALANTLKHRSVVRPELNEDCTGTRDEKWILFFESFSYLGEEFKKTDAREFMKKEHDRIQPLTVNIGMELNKVLQKTQL